jgi:hypothetical protein
MKREKVKIPGGTGFPACAGAGELLIRRRNLPHWELWGAPISTLFGSKRGYI